MFCLSSLAYEKFLMFFVSKVKPCLAMSKTELNCLTVNHVIAKGPVINYGVEGMTF